MRRKAEAGFTLIELTLVAAILGLLAAIAIPKFSDLIEKSREAADLGSLGTLRSAVSLYYADNEGTPPSSNLASALYPKYISKPMTQFRPRPRPKTIRQPHPGSFDYMTVNTGPNPLSSIGIGDDGAWIYKVNNYGAHQLKYACTHSNLKGVKWSTH